MLLPVPGIAIGFGRACGRTVRVAFLDILAHGILHIEELIRTDRRIDAGKAENCVPIGVDRAAMGAHNPLIYGAQAGLSDIDTVGTDQQQIDSRLVHGGGKLGNLVLCDAHKVDLGIRTVHDHDAIECAVRRVYAQVFHDALPFLPYDRNHLSYVDYSIMCLT